MPRAESLPGVDLGPAGPRPAGQHSSPSRGCIAASAMYSCRTNGRRGREQRSPPKTTRLYRVAVRANA